MSETAREKVWRPTRKELGYALHVASSAKRVCAGFIENGRPSAKDFMDLCAELDNLENHIVGASSFDDRAEDLLCHRDETPWRDE